MRTSAFGDLEAFRRRPPSPSPSPSEKKIEKPAVPEINVRNYKCCLTVDDFDAYMSPVFAKSVPCACDIETSPLDAFRDEPKAALDPHKSDITGISFSHTPGTGIYIPLAHRVGKNFELRREEFLKLLYPIFFRGYMLKIVHNIAFESMFMYKHGIVIQEPAYDTIAASQLSLKNPNEFRELQDSGLKLLSEKILGIKQTTFAEVTNGKHFDELDPEDPATTEYGCADSDHALRLYFYFEEWFAKHIPKHSWYCRHVDTPACIYTGLMKYNGIAVNKDLMLQKKAAAETKLSELRGKILEFIGPGIDIGKNASTKALEKWMFDIKGYPVLSLTDKGGRSMDDETFQMLIDWCREHDRPEDVEFIKLLQEYRKWGKLLSTYIVGYMEHINSVTGKIHADLLPTVTDTSRFASQRPNLQNMPRKDNDPTKIRSFFIASEGNRFIDFDFSQIELRVGAVYCRDEKMLHVYRTGGDIHSQTTSVLYNIPLEQAKDKNAPHYKERRTIAKNFNFGKSKIAV